MENSTLVAKIEALGMKAFTPESPYNTPGEKVAENLAATPVKNNFGKPVIRLTDGPKVLDIPLRSGVPADKGVYSLVVFRASKAVDGIIKASQRAFKIEAGAARVYAM